jgi:hypothetical protein
VANKVACVNNLGGSQMEILDEINSKFEGNKELMLT